MQTFSDFGLVNFLACMHNAHPALHADLVLCVLAVLGVAWPIGAMLRVARVPAIIHPRRSADLAQFRSARRDPLTALPNRAHFAEAFASRLQAGTRSALLLIDLDRFRSINHAQGHRAGDDLLVAIAGRLRQLVPDTDQLARLGGDEFAVLVNAGSGQDDVEGTALTVLRTLMAPMLAGTEMVSCSVSIGIALIPGHARDVDHALRAAHVALEQVKTAGGGAFGFFDAAADKAAGEREAMKAELRAAIPAGQIIPYYQPIVDLQTGELTGLEVLARWNHPGRGVLAPEMFVALAEEMDMAGQLTQWLMRRVVRDCRDWPPDLYFALNVSPGQLRELIGMVRNPPIWPEGELDPRRLEIEVTENALIDDIDLAREMMAQVQAKGSRVVLDDFGIGNSNFFHLRELPFDRIKIDRSFVIDSAANRRAEACVRAMLALGASLGIKMVAQGIETLQQAEHLTQLGCHHGQGFVYSPPIPADLVHPMIRRFRRVTAAATAA